jgi:hypothetical protein
MSPVTPVISTGSVSPVHPIVSLTTSGEVSYVGIEKSYGITYAGFIKRIISEWDKIVQAYAMPK